jgi:hypothetical protein
MSFITPVTPDEMYVKHKIVFYYSLNTHFEFRRKKIKISPAIVIKRDFDYEIGQAPESGYILYDP